MRRSAPRLLVAGAGASILDVRPLGIHKLPAIDALPERDLQEAIPATAIQAQWMLRAAASVKVTATFWGLLDAGWT